MRNSSIGSGSFGRAVMPLPGVAVLLILVVCAVSPSVGQVGPMAPAPWQLPPAHESWLDDPGTCTAGTCAVGGDWGYAYQRHLGYHPYVNQPWFRGEYLMWWTKAANTPPLASTDELPAGDILAGGPQGGSAGRLGARLSFGWWLSPCEVWGVETSYMFLRTGTIRHRLTSDDHPDLARPFFNVQTPPREDAVFLATLATPGDEGSFDADLSHRLDSVEVLLRRVVARRCDRHWDLVFGYRYAGLDEQLAIQSASTFLAETRVSDRFHTANEFHGAELGIVTGTRYCAWSLDVMAKVALGGTRSRVTVDGSTVATVPGQDPVSHPAGMLALSSNIGTREQSSFSAIPELRVTLGWDLTCRLKATLGYSLLYWSRVARPGDQIDRNLDPAQFPIPEGVAVGFPAPAPLFVLTDYWAQGLSFGLDYRF